MGFKRAILLSDVEGWSDEHVANLKGRWIATAQQVVAIYDAPGGLSAMASQLGVSEADMKKLVDLAKQKLVAEGVSALEPPADASRFGLGALLGRPSNKKQ